MLSARRVIHPPFALVRIFSTSPKHYILATMKNWSKSRTLQIILVSLFGTILTTFSAIFEQEVFILLVTNSASPSSTQLT
jgi:hypothetical protein